MKRWIAAAALVFGAISLGIWLRAGDAPAPRAPVAVDLGAAGPEFTTLEDLTAASDLVVVADVEAVDPGRVITDPTDPAIGIRTQLSRLRVDEALKGTASAPLVVEEEAALLDGTPVTLGGASPSVQGEHLLLFLIAGDSESAPYHAVIGAPGRYRVDGTDVTATSRDDLSTAIAMRSLDDIESTIRSQEVQP